MRWRAKSFTTSSCTCAGVLGAAVMRNMLVKKADSSAAEMRPLPSVSITQNSCSSLSSGRPLSTRAMECRNSVKSSSPLPSTSHCLNRPLISAASLMPMRFMMFRKPSKSSTSAPAALALAARVNSESSRSASVAVKVSSALAAWMAVFNRSRLESRGPSIVTVRPSGERKTGRGFSACTRSKPVPAAAHHAAPARCTHLVHDHAHCDQSCHPHCHLHGALLHHSQRRAHGE